MLDKVLTALATNAKLAIAATAGAALVAGGSAVAVTQVADSTPTAPTSTVSAPLAAAGDDANEAAEHRSDTSTATIEPKPTKSPKPTKAPKTKDCNHGKAVSAAAHDKSKHGRDHGKAVSAVAQDKSACVKSTDGASESDATQAPRPAKTAKADDGDQHETDADQRGSDDQGTAEQGSDGQGRDGGSGHGKSGSKHGKG